MARSVMRQRTNRSNGARMKQGFAIVENLMHCCRLLRARRERPRCRRAAEQRDELAPSHYSITSSAVASSCVGTSRPSALAVFRLMAISYLVGA
jgi:hypothetical protein